MISIPPTSNLFHKTLHFEPHIFKFKGALLPRHAACFHKSTMIEYHKKGGGEGEAFRSHPRNDSTSQLKPKLYQF